MWALHQIIKFDRYMGRFLIIMSILALTSCKDRRLLKYEQVVLEATKLQIVYNASNKTITIPEQQIVNFKHILSRNVKPELQREFINDVRIDIFKDNRRTAFLLINNSDKLPFVNFNSDSVNFGFRLTYGIGQTLNQYIAENNR